MAGQENATQRVVKKQKEDQTFVLERSEMKISISLTTTWKTKLFVTTAKKLELVNLHEGPQQEAIDKAKEELKQGLDITVVRQKWIKVTDCSEYSWETVDEYEQDQLAADEENAKRLGWEGSW